MRKASTLVGLTLVALGAGARAEDRPPAALAPAAAVVAPAPAAPAPPAPVTAVVVAPGPAAAAPARRIELGLAFLPMAIGKITSPVGSDEVMGGAKFAYGISLAASYQVIAGLRLGLAPQAIFNVDYKVNPSQLISAGAASEYDILVRVAYVQPIVDTIAVYAEALPGYSIIALPGTSPAKGFVLALGGGVAMDLGDRAFVNLGAGYQLGFQTVTVSGSTFDDRTRYLRVVLGGGVRF